MRPIGPCKGCEARSAECHARCWIYKAFEEENAIYREAAFKRRSEIEQLDHMRAYRERSIKKRKPRR